MINLILTEFPIIGPLRFTSLVLEWICVFFSFELAMNFLIKYKKQPDQLKNSQDLGFFTLILGFSLMWFFFLMGDYYSTNFIISPFLLWSYGSYRSLFLNFGYISINIGALFFTFFMEKYKKFLFKRFFFTFCFLGQLLIYIIIFFINLEITNSISIDFWPLFLLFFIVYIRDLSKKAKKQEIVKRGALKMFFTILLIWGGFILSIDLVIDILGLIFRLIGIILQLIAIVLIFIFFRSIPPFFELEWEDKIENIYILNKNGAYLYHKSFIESTEVLDSHFITGALASVNIMLNEMIDTKEKGNSIIKKKGKILNIFSSEYITGVLISKEDLKFFRHNLKKLILKVEEIYKNALINWNGNVGVFFPVKNIIDDIFS